MTAEPIRAELGLSAPSLAKVNLTLHVTGRRSDGYHLLDSLVVFPSVGDFIEVEPASSLSLTLDGAQGFALDAGPENLVLRAALALREAFGLSPECGASIRLEKNLPIAGGIGGGSANAATALKLLSRLWGLKPSADRLAEIGLGLGADVPVCLGAPTPQMMRGVGERLSAAPALPKCALALVNPGVAVPTGPVFSALEGRFGASPPAAPAHWADFAAFVHWLKDRRNDLEQPAQGLAPEIGAVLTALRAEPACALARMSGSGGTCFGLFETFDAAADAAATLGRRNPGWWVAAAPLAGDASS